MPLNITLTGLSAQQVLGLVFGVLVFAAVLGGFAFLAKRLSGGRTFSGRRIKILERAVLSKDACLLLVQIGTRLITVGVGRSGISLLCELSASDFPEFSQKADEPSGNSPSGFWNRFARNMKANIAGNPPEDPAADASFAELLRNIADSDPVNGAVSAGDAGHGHMREEFARTPPPRPRRPNYQVNIDNMSRLSHPDAFDRKSHAPRAPEPHHNNAAPPVRKAVPPPAEPEIPAPDPEERTERIDQLLDLIAQRQSRLDEKNRAGEEE